MKRDLRLNELKILVLDKVLYSTRSGQDGSGSAHEVFLRRGMEKAVRLMESLTAPEALGNIFCLDSVFSC